MTILLWRKGYPQKWRSCFPICVTTTRIGVFLQGLNVQKERHMVESEKVENLLGMMMDGANYCVDGYIAERQNFQYVYISMSNLRPQMPLPTYLLYCGSVKNVF